VARKSNSGLFSIALYAVGGYFLYSNWSAISAWFAAVVPLPTAGPATASGTYANSPVPTSYSTNQTFVDSAGNQWQFSTQTGTWVIASHGPTPPSPSAGTVISTLGPVMAAPPIAAVPASPGTVVPTNTLAPVPQPGALPIRWGAPSVAAPVPIAPHVQTLMPMTTQARINAHIVASREFIA